jgi:fumarate hydratase, class II
MSDGVRIEKDSMGEVRVPEGALYGAQTQRAVENFPISGQRFGRPFLHALGVIKQAAARSNGELGFLDEEVAGAIARAAKEVAGGMWDDQFPIDVYQTGSGTSTNMNTNEVVARRASQLLEGTGKSVHPNDHVNFGQSSNDVIPTAIHVSARLEIERTLIPALTNLRDALLEKARAFDHVVKSGRTHLMDATPVRLGQEFAGYARQVTLGIERVQRASDELGELALGGTAVGTGINTHPEFARRTIARIAELTGVPFREAEDHFEAQGARDAAVSVSGALNVVAVSLMKIADDIRWLASGPTSGLSEIFLPAIQPGSSIMPGKVNPVMSEALMMVCARVMGNHTTVTVGGSRGNFELNVMLPVIAVSLLESIQLLAHGTMAFTERAVRGISANEPRARQLLELNPSIATALNPYIGYDRAAEVAKESAREGISVRDVVQRRGLLPPEQLDEALNVRDMTEPGVGGSSGGGGWGGPGTGPHAIGLVVEARGARVHGGRSGERSPRALEIGSAEPPALHEAAEPMGGAGGDPPRLRPSLAARADAGLRVAGAHDSYLINLSSPDATLFERSVKAFTKELARCAALALDFLVTHPGNATDGDLASGWARNAEGVTRALESVEGPPGSCWRSPPARGAPWVPPSRAWPPSWRGSRSPGGPGSGCASTPAMRTRPGTIWWGTTTGCGLVSRTCWAWSGWGSST